MEVYKVLKRTCGAIVLPIKFVDLPRSCLKSLSGYEGS